MSLRKRFVTLSSAIATIWILKRGEEQNRKEGEMAQKKLGGGRNRGEK